MDDLNRFSFSPLAGMLTDDGQPPLRMGFADADITPTERVHLGGYTKDARSLCDPETDVTERTRVQVWVLERGGKRLVFANAEMVGFSEESRNVSAGFAHRLAGLAGTEDENVLLINVHNHQNRVSLDAACEDRVADAVCRACGALTEVTLSLSADRMDYGTSRSPFYNVSEIHPYDNRLYLLSVRRADSGTPLALIYSYPVHNTLLGKGCPEAWHIVSCEFTGYASRFIEEQMRSESPDFHAFHLNGFWGNSGPLIDDGVHTTYADTEALKVYGRRLGKTLFEKYSAMEPGRVVSGELRGLVLRDSMPTRKFDRCFVDYPSFGDTKELPVLISAAQIGDLAVIGANFEVFSVTGARLRAEAPYPLVFPTASVKGWKGYVPTAETFAHDGPGWEEQECTWTKTAFDRTSEQSLYQMLFGALCRLRGVDWERIYSRRVSVSETDAGAVYRFAFPASLSADKLVLSFGQEFRTDCARDFSLRLLDEAENEVFSLTERNNSTNHLGWFLPDVPFRCAELTVREVWRIPEAHLDRYPLFAGRLTPAKDRLPAEIHAIRFRKR